MMRAVVLVTGGPYRGRQTEQEVVAWDGKRHLTTRDDAGREHAWLMPSGVNTRTPHMRVERVDVVPDSAPSDEGRW